MNLEKYLPDQDFTLRMRFEKNDIAPFYRPLDFPSPILAQRSQIIAQEPHLCLALLPEGHAPLAETITLAQQLHSLPPDSSFTNLTPPEQCAQLGRLWEPDFLIMSPDPQGTLRLVAGCLCFPSHWDLQEKIGHPMTTIHAPVADLNQKLGRQIDGFLSKIKPGLSWERDNWGLSRTPELNLHPTHPVPRLDPTVTLDEVYLRIEEQSLVALPTTQSVLFGIRVIVYPLHDVKANPLARRGLIRALQTMPEPMAQYKGFAPARARLLDLLN